MSELGDFLRQTLTGTRVAVLGVGSALCRDDGAGALAVREIRRVKGSEALLLLSGESAPENFTGVIKAFAPEALFIIDAAYMDLPAGSLQLLPYEKAAGLSFSTHMLPLGLMVDYLMAECGCRCYVIGIQPGNTGQGIGISRRVREGVRILAGLFAEALAIKKAST